MPYTLYAQRPGTPGPIVNNNGAPHREMTKSNEYKATGEQKAGEEGTTTNEEELTQKYEPTAREHAALERLRAADPPVRLKLNYQGEAVPDHPDQQVGWALVCEALGIADIGFARYLLAQLVTACAWNGTVEEDDLNSLFGAVASHKPGDGFEAMLIAQMIQVYAATTRTGNRVTNVDFIRGSHFKKRGRHHSEQMLALSTVVRTFSNLAGRFTEQLRTLDNHRRGGDQNVMIHNVSVSHGGQAIVANLPRAERRPPPERRPSSEMSSPPALTDSPAVPMPVIEPSRNAVPLERKSNGKARP
jgi:hypothetical protein